MWQWIEVAGSKDLQEKMLKLPIRIGPKDYHMVSPTVQFQVEQAWYVYIERFGAFGYMQMNEGLEAMCIDYIVVLASTSRGPTPHGRSLIRPKAFTPTSHLRTSHGLRGSSHDK